MDESRFLCLREAIYNELRLRREKKVNLPVSEEVMRIRNEREWKAEMKTYERVHNLVVYRGER